MVSEHPWIHRIAALAAAAAAVLSAAACNSREFEDAPVQLLIAADPDSASAEAQVVAQHDALLAALANGASIEHLTTRRFWLTDGATGSAPEDSVTVAQMERVTRLLQQWNVPVALDGEALDQVRHLAAVDAVETYVLGPRQVVLVARGEGRAVAMSSWLLEAGEWRALSLVVNPTDRMLATLRQRAQMTSMARSGR